MPRGHFIKLMHILPYSIFKGMPRVAVLEKSFCIWSLLLEKNSHSEICVWKCFTMVYQEARTFLHYFCQPNHELLSVSMYSQSSIITAISQEKEYLKTRSDDLQCGPNNMYVNTITEHCRLRTFHENCIIWVCLQTSLIMTRQTNNSSILHCQIVHWA